jgi:hypothetical protein
MPPRSEQRRAAVRLLLTVTDVLGVQRVLTMLTGRRYTLTRFAPTARGDGHWRVTLDVLADADQVELLGARLDRSPSVLTLASSRAPHWPPTG